MKIRSASQSMMEYTIVIGLVALAILGMQTYARRGLQVVIKLAADPIGDQRDYTKREQNMFSVGDPVGPSMTEASDAVHREGLDVREVSHGAVRERIGNFQEGASTQVTYEGYIKDKVIP